jgi:hypothetical protein
MEQLQQAVNDAFGRVLSSGAVEAAIEKNIAETIQSIVRDQLRAYSPFAKALEEQVAKALQVDFSRVDLPSYGQLVLNIVRRLVEAETDKQLAKTIEPRLKELLVGAPEEVSLQQLVTQFIEHSANDFCNDHASSNERITLIVTPMEYGSRWVYMDARQGREKYSCDISFLISRDTQKISALRLDRREADKTLFIGPLYGFERTLFQMHAAGTRLTGLDEDIETTYPERD